MTAKTTPLLLLFLLALPWVGGCNVFAYLGYVVAPGEDQTKTVAADYKGPDLSHRSLAVVVCEGQQIQYEYPTAREHVARAVASRLSDKEVLERLKGLRVIDPSIVLDYQERNIHWDEMDRTQLARALGADFVLFVSLAEFSTHEPMSINLLQGTIKGDLSLHKADLPERESRVYKCEGIQVVYPKNTPGGVPGYDDTPIRREMVRQFAQKVAWKFYKHQEPVEP